MAKKAVHNPGEETMLLSHVQQLLHHIKFGPGNQTEVIQALTEAVSALAKVVQEHEDTIHRLTTKGTKRDDRSSDCSEKR